MPVVAVVEGLTQEQYEESVRRVTGGKSRVESPADWPVEGLLAHIAGQGNDRAVDGGDGPSARTGGLLDAHVRLSLSVGLGSPGGGVRQVMDDSGRSARCGECSGPAAAWKTQPGRAQLREG
jgi:hypothetical protein